MKTRKGFGLNLIMGMVLIAILMGVAIILATFSVVLSVQTLTYAEESMQTGTTLSVIMNNNELSTGTTLPFKDILAIAIAKGHFRIETDVKLRYNGATETVNLKDILTENLEKMGIEEYHFYVEYGLRIMDLKTPGFTKNSTEEIVYIAIPSPGTDAKVVPVVLRISKEKQKDISQCPDLFGYKCYPRYTCKEYGGTCADDDYVCGPAECCCENAGI